MIFIRTENEQPNIEKNWQRSALLMAISSSFSIFFTHPLDVVRIQMQSQFLYISPRQVLRNIIKFRGFHGIYYGLLAAVQREFLYCLLRFSFYERARSQGLVENFRHKIGYAGLSGFFAGLIATPLTKVVARIRTDAARKPSLRYNYSHVLHGLHEIYREGGLKNFYNMAATCALRGLLITVCQCSIYYQVKEILQKNIKFKSDWECFLLASTIAGGITAVALTPIDLVENIGHNTHAKRFCGEWNIVRRLNSFYGWHGFYRGLYANFMRNPPQTIITFLMYEEMNRVLFKKYEI